MPSSTSTVYLNTLAVPWPTCGVVPGTTCQVLSPASVNGTAIRQRPGRQVGVERGQPARRCVDDRGAHRADGRRALDGLTRRGLRRTGAGHRLVDDHRGEHHQNGQRIRAPAIGGHEPSQPRLFAPLARPVTIGPGPSGAPADRVTQRPQRFSPLVTQHGHSTGAAHGPLGRHCPRMAQLGREDVPGAPECTARHRFCQRRRRR